MDSENKRDKKELKEIEFLIRKLNKGLSQNKYIENKIALQKSTNLGQLISEIQDILYSIKEACKINDKFNASNLNRKSSELIDRITTKWKFEETESSSNHNKKSISVSTKSENVHKDKTSFKDYCYGCGCGLNKWKV